MVRDGSVGKWEGQNGDREDSWEDLGRHEVQKAREIIEIIL
jgi:hypothetical protein